MTKLHEGERQENEPDSPLEIIERALISAHDVTSEDAERATEWLAELRRRDWAVRVLDECARHRGEVFVTQPVYDKDDDSEGWECSASEDLGWFDLYSDTARHAAATAMFPTLPDSLRDKLGECP